MSISPLRIYRLSDQELEEFRKILHECIGHEFSSDDAAKLADMLMNALALIRDVTVQEELKGLGQR